MRQLQGVMTWKEEAPELIPGKPQHTKRLGRWGAKSKRNDKLWKLLATTRPRRMTKKWVAETRWRTRSFKEAAVEELKECSKDHPCEYLNKNYSKNHFYRSDNVTVTTFFILQKKKVPEIVIIEYDKLIIWESSKVFINEGRRSDKSSNEKQRGQLCQRRSNAVA